MRVPQPQPEGAPGQGQQSPNWRGVSPSLGRQCPCGAGGVSRQEANTELDRISHLSLSPPEPSGGTLTPDLSVLRGLCSAPEAVEDGRAAAAGQVSWDTSLLWARGAHLERTLRKGGGAGAGGWGRGCGGQSRCLQRWAVRAEQGRPWPAGKASLPTPQQGCLMGSELPVPGWLQAEVMRWIHSQGLCPQGSLALSRAPQS